MCLRAVQGKFLKISAKKVVFIRLLFIKSGGLIRKTSRRLINSSSTPPLHSFIRQLPRSLSWLPTLLTESVSAVRVRSLVGDVTNFVTLIARSLAGLGQINFLLCDQRCVARAARPPSDAAGWMAGWLAARQ